MSQSRESKSLPMPIAIANRPVTVGEKNPLKLADIRCPISLNIMMDPVILNCGHSFDADSINGHDIHNCPVCRVPITSREHNENLDKQLEFFYENLKDQDPEVINSLAYDGDLLIKHFLYNTLTLHKRMKLLVQIKPELLNEISTEKLNDTTQFDLYKGSSIAYSLITIFGNTLLKTDILARIAPETINSIITTGNTIGYSIAMLVSALCSCDEILKKGLLIPHISAPTLNAMIPTGEDEGESVASYLAATEDGRKLLRETKLADQISELTLNTPIKEGNNKGLSVAFILIHNSEGRKLLHDFPNLKAKLNPDNLMLLKNTEMKEVYKRPYSANLMFTAVLEKNEAKSQIEDLEPPAKKQKLEESSLFVLGLGNG